MELVLKRRIFKNPVDAHLFKVEYRKLAKIKSVISFDFETTGFNVLHGKDRPFSWIFTNEKLESKIFRVDRISMTTKKYKRALQILKAKLLDPTIAFTCHNYMFELQVLKSLFPGLDFDKIFFHDTLLMAQVLKNNLYNYKLEVLSKNLLQYECPWDLEVKNDITKQKRNFTQQKNNKNHSWLTERFSRLKKAGIKPFNTVEPNYGLIDPRVMKEYQIADGERGMLLYLLFWPEIINDKEVLNDYIQELLLVKTTQKMMQYGICYNARGANNLLRMFKKTLTSHESVVKKELGYLPNINSSAQLQKIIYTDLKLPILDYTPAGKPSCSSETLNKLNEINTNPIFNSIMGVRSFSKAISMVDSYKNLCDNNGIIHPSINTNFAITGRQSCSGPNLQNVQKSNSLKSKFSIPVRKAFRARNKHIIWLIDYSGIELRLIVDVVNEEKIIKIINENGDPHLYNTKIIADNFWNTALILFDDIDTVKAAQKYLRTLTKELTFSTAYGAKEDSVYNYIARSKIKMEYVDQIFSQYLTWKDVVPGIGYFKQTLEQIARKQGYIKTAFGRKLYMEANESYKAANYAIQGLSAQILKRAENRLHYLYKKEFDDQVKLIVPIHDEILIEFPRTLLKYKDEIFKITSSAMTNMPEIKVKLDVEVKQTTTDWTSTKELAFND